MDASSHFVYCYEDAFARHGCFGWLLLQTSKILVMCYHTKYRGRALRIVVAF